MFDDQIETLSLFDPLTGEVLRKLPRFTVYPSTHYVTPRARAVGGEEIRGELRTRLQELNAAASSSRRSACNSARCSTWR